MATRETYTLRVEGEQTMHCAGCANAVEVGLSDLPGVQHVTAEHTTQQVEVSTDVEQTDLDAIRAQLGRMGYQTELAS